MATRTIQYAVEHSTGLVISRVGGEVCIPVLQYNDMSPENNFETTYKPEKMDVSVLFGYHDNYTWTKKIPVEIKNKHREFWGFKPLKTNV